ncbi:MAG: hypothetical protein AAGA99_01775 [Actinomycetota bacterium]
MTIDPEQVEHGQAALDDVRDEWLARHGVIAVEVARLWRDGQPVDEVCMRVTVERLLPPESVRTGELFPRHHEAVRVQVVEGHPPSPQ